MPISIKIFLFIIINVIIINKYISYLNSTSFSKKKITTKDLISLIIYVTIMSKWIYRYDV